MRILLLMGTKKPTTWRARGGSLAGDGKLVMQGRVSKSAALPGEEDGDGGNEGGSGGERSAS